MPNWCHNRVDIYSENLKDLKAIKSIFKSERPLHQIIPEPDWYTVPLSKEDSTKYGNKVGKVGELPIPPDLTEKWSTTHFKSTGHSDERWYDWRINNWGIKWDIADIDIEHEDKNQITYSFETPWGPPQEICEALREKFENVNITWFYDEPGMALAGYL